MIYPKPEVAKLLSQLSSYNFKKLEKGEKVLLAKAISDTLPLCSEETADVNTYMLTHKNRIFTILDAISHFLYIEDKELMYSLVKDFMQWRHRIAFNPPIVTFNSGTDGIVDDLSSLGKFVDKSAMSDILNVHNNATYLYGVFRNVATLV
jgi:hypothetical protein